MLPDYEIHDPKGWCGDPQRGAALGRPTYVGDRNYSGRLYLRRVRLNQGGYDRNGTYFGTGEPLYWCANDDLSIDFMLRASSRHLARASVIARYPNAKIRK